MGYFKVFEGYVDPPKMGLISFVAETPDDGMTAIGGAGQAGRRPMNMPSAAMPMLPHM